MKLVWIASLVTYSAVCGADLGGNWIAQLSGLGDTQYARVTLRTDSSKLSGSWNDWNIEGIAEGNQIQLKLSQPNGQAAGSLTATLDGVAFAGTGQVAGGRGRQAASLQNVVWKLTRAAVAPPSGPKTWTFPPSEFQRYYSASIAPVLRVFPGDTVRTSTVDSGGTDANRERRSPGGNPVTGPFYIEGALPGDTLVVKLNKIRLNRDTAHSGNRINGRTVTPAFVAAAKYSDAFDSEWTLDRQKGVALLAHPTERMKNYKVPILPMLGCLATAPAGDLSYRATDLGPFGGNMDYNQMIEGAILYLPVFQPGALFSLGDGHAAMGDGELTGGALETSLDVEFSVDLMKGTATANPRLENAEFLMSMGIAGSIPESIQAATAQLGTWLKATYRLNDNELALVLGTALKYDITEMVDSQYNVVAKVPKSALAGLQ